MIYLLQMPFEKELNARIDYLSNAFDSFFIQIDRNQDFIKLQSFPLIEDNTIIFYGHNFWIREYFMRFGSSIQNSTKIINSCDLLDRSVFNKQKNLYYSKCDDHGRVIRYPGSEFNLRFDVTQSEIEMLIKRSLSLKERIASAYRKAA